MEQKKANGGVLIKILMMAILPLLCGTAILILISTNTIKSGMSEEALTGLEDMAKSVAQVFESIAPGEWHIDGDELHKGEFNFSQNQEMLDNFVQTSDIELTFFYGDTRYATTLKDDQGNRIVGTQASAEIADHVLKKGEAYTSTDTNIAGQAYFAYYLPVKSGNQVIGMIFAGKPQAEVITFVNSKLGLIIIPGIIVFFAAGAICVVAGGRIAKGIREAEKVVEIIAGGDLTQKPSDKMLKRNDEVGSIARATERLRTSLANIIKEIMESSEMLTQSGKTLDDMASQTEGTASEIVNAVEGISRGAVTQAEEIETACGRVSDMGLELDNITESVGRLDQVSGEMEAAGDASGKIIDELTVSNDKTIEAVAHIGRQVHATNEAAEKIKIAINAITEIAEQTNLLSLNASIEAARAGEQGKGFAVVASEIQKLATESAESAELISRTVEGLNKESEKSIEAMNSVRDIITVQVEKLKETTNRFANVTDGIHTSRGETESIKQKTGVCDDAKNAIIDIMSNLSAISEENAASTQETNASMEELNATINLLAAEAARIGEMAVALEEKIRIFKI